MSSAISIILRPLAAYYDDATTVEMRMTRPKRVIVDRRGEGKRIVEAPELTLARIEDMCRSLANVTGVLFDPDTAPKLSCIVPEVRHRFECLVGSSVQTGVSMAIRCKHPFTPTWDQVGASAPVVSYLRAALMAERNMIVSGATNTGKTTLLNKLLEFLPADRRVVACEDTPELHIDRFWDGVGLLAAREASTASGMIDWRQLYDHQMRATPDHVIFGEISTQNAFAALGALNSGITGFMCTIHAESPYQVLHRKFDQNIAWSGQTMPRVPEFLAELVDVIVQIKRTTDGYRRITDIYEPRADRWVMRDGELQERIAA
ncbi:CpaF/VirB11 family protein [Magnetospirillum sp. UT-4]|uniref:CpaF/VirB11 family protein n=1 Tax=Magnetospirillum sp. UT-4 TaxID=2681467 RepID=UPI001571BC82|nr:CpaF/VirB11 family protein [Magnetospirillum sp. UT-4]